MPDTSSLFSPPMFKTFEATPAGRRDLQKVLDDSFRNTLVAPPAIPRDVRLSHTTRKTQSGFRYVSTALFRVCRALAPGLSHVVNNLAGPTRHDAGSREVYSTEVACAVFNQIVDLRFNGVLAKTQFMMDERNKTIEGMLGPQTHFLENATFLELVESSLEDSCGAVFAGASLAGRRLFARYIQPDHIETRWGNYQRGFAVCSAEAGDDSIRAYVMYQHMETGNCCLEVPTGGIYRQRRTGSKFMEQIKRLLVRLSMSEMRDLGHDFNGLADRKLFTKIDADIIDLVLARWQRQLKLAGMPSDVAVAVTASVIYPNGDNGEPPSTGLLSSLSEYDLFVAAMKASQHRGQRVREIAERAAFRVFLGEGA